MSKPKPAASTRGKKGQFAKGNPGGPGRPPKTREDKYLDEFRKTVSIASIGRVTKKLLEMAESGDLKAMDLLLKYAIGKPLDYVAPIVIEAFARRPDVVYRIDPAYEAEKARRLADSEEADKIAAARADNAL